MSTITLKQVEEWLVKQVPEPESIQEIERGGRKAVMVMHKAVAPWGGMPAATIRLMLIGAVTDDGRVKLGASWLVSQASIDCTHLIVSDLAGEHPVAAYRDTLLAGLSKLSVLVNTLINAIAIQIDESMPRLIGVRQIERTGIKVPTP